MKIRASRKWYRSKQAVNMEKYDSIVVFRDVLGNFPAVGAYLAKYLTKKFYRISDHQ